MIKRERCLQQIRPFYDSEMIKVITGIRRCGKSTLMQQIMEEIGQQNVAADHIIYINFEDYQYKKISTPDTLYEYVEAKITDGRKYYLFIDEIQNVPDFELVVNSFRATHNISIFMTGSNSKLLSGELATHLSGRTLSFRIMPFCFQEFVAFYRENGTNQSVEQLLDSYMLWGGFPLVCKEKNDKDKDIILSNIYDSVVLKDVVMRNKIASVTALDRVLEYVVAGSALTISGNTIAASLKADGINISAPTIYDYLKYISDACICDKVSRYDIRGKKVLAYEEKTYVCDLGFFHLKKNRIKEEYGHIVETICYNELISRGYQVYVGKTHKSEVDFIAQKGKEKFYLQAAYLLDSEETAAREFDAYQTIKDNYPKYVISADRIPLTRDGIIHKNLCDWLLEDI
ncbi:MAG: ATP-binding protein [Bacteroidales bacterium]|nr:ATP-binding protein [Bacteroidales bacterium]MCM1415159.1 ATP-binding protein [bacterium]MCM1423381.1 ATP-binding protein [bacterium]